MTTMITILSGGRARAWLALSLCALWLTGCSTQMSMLKSTAQLALWGQEDVTVTPQKVNALPYASAYLKVGKAPRAFVVLGFVDHQQLTWVTADRNTVVTRNGRVVQTQGFGEDIRHVANLEQDPLQRGLLKPGTPMSWRTTVSWSKVMRGEYALESTFVNRGHQSLEILGRAVDTVRFEEQVTVPTLNEQYTNQFWLDAATGRVVQSEQYMGPDMALVRFTVLKPFYQ